MLPEKFWVREADWEAMRAHVLACAPEEACGLLAGTGARASLVVPIENQSHSPVRFRMEPAAQVRAMMDFERSGLELVGIFHSHPSGPPAPSATDLGEAAYPEAAYLVWHQTGQGWRCEAYRLVAGDFHPLSLELEGG